MAVLCPELAAVPPARLWDLGPAACPGAEGLRLLLEETDAEEGYNCTFSEHAVSLGAADAWLPRAPRYDCSATTAPPTTARYEAHCGWSTLQQATAGCSRWRACRAVVQLATRPGFWAWGDSSVGVLRQQPGGAEVAFVKSCKERRGDLEGCFNGVLSEEERCCGEVPAEAGTCWDHFYWRSRCCGSAAAVASHGGRSLASAGERSLSSAASPTNASASERGDVLSSFGVPLCWIRLRGVGDPRWQACRRRIVEWTQSLTRRRKEADIKGAGKFVYLWAVRHLRWDLAYFAALLYATYGASASCVRLSIATMRRAWPQTGGLTFEMHFPLCTEHDISTAISYYRLGGFHREAKALFRASVESRLVRWPTSRHTPTDFFPLLESKVWWTDDARVAPVARTVARAQSVVAAEVAALEKARGVPVNDAYSGINRRKTWSSIVLFTCNHGWHAEGCGLLPRSCALLRAALTRQGALLPSPTYCLTDHHERLSVLRVAPGSEVPRHKGMQHMINIHVGLLGLQDTYIRVMERNKTWSTKETFAFQDSFDHSVHHEGTEPRFVLMMTISHPQWRHFLDNAYGRQGNQYYSQDADPDTFLEDLCAAYRRAEPADKTFCPERRDLG